MPVNKKPSNKAVPSKSTYKKPKKQDNSIFIIVGLVLFILFFSGSIFFIHKTLSKKNNGENKKKTETHYITANKEQEKLEVKTYIEKEQNKQVALPEKLPVKTQKTDNNQQSKTIVSKNKTYVNKFVSPEREWQPINPGLREATNRYKNIVYGGKPVTTYNLLLLENMSYYSAYSESKRNPLWVAYRLDSFQGKNVLPRLTKFLPDFRTKSRIQPKVYSKTGYDKGHMCPNSAIAARYGKEGQKETFLMSNISPQTPELNRKVWERLERLEEAYANKFGGIWVITGPIFDQHIELLNRQVEIPDAFFKILIDEDKGKIRVLPFIIPQNVTGKEITNQFLTSVDEIEKQTGLDFFYPMDDKYEKLLESYVPEKTMWN